MSATPSSKRHRTLSSSSSSASEHTSKASRVVPNSEPSANSVTIHPLLCTLPPTCNHHPTPIANTKDLESHYATYHAHVCEEAGCACVFPEARLLELHQTECHDPLAALRKDRGEKIFACHLASCTRLFQTPKARRLHLIQAHGYPKEYFFAVTNKGVGGLLKRWGEGASLVRKEWKARETTSVKGNEMRGEEEDDGDDSDDEEEENDSMMEEADEDMNMDDNQATPRIQPTRTLGNAEETDAHFESLIDSLDSLSLIPSSVRFGRGGTRAGFVHNPGGRGRGGGGHYTPVDTRGRGRGVGGTPIGGYIRGWIPRGRGRGGPRGRGRGRGE